MIIRSLSRAEHFPAGVMRSFLAPLDMPMPGPLLRRPIRIRRMKRALRRRSPIRNRARWHRCSPALPGGVEEARVAVAAAYDTTAHALAFALWEVGCQARAEQRTRPPRWS